MLHSIIIQHWREATGVDRHIQATAAKDASKARKLFQHLSKLNEDKARSFLAGTEDRRTLPFFSLRSDEQLNRSLSWMLLSDALKLPIPKEINAARNLLWWAELIGEFGSGEKDREEGLPFHCEFYRGILSHSTEALVNAEECYARAETGYRDSGAGLTLQGLAIYARGHVALETGSEEEAQKQFQRAHAILQQGTAQTVYDDMQKIIERSLRQRQLAKELIGAENVDTLLDSQRELVDSELLTMLAASVWLQAVNHHPVTEVLHNAHNVERVAQKLGQTSDCIEMLLNYYKLHHQNAGVEAILRELSLTRPGDLDLQKDLAIALFQQGNHLEARRFLLKVLKKRPNDASVHSFFGMVLYMLNDKAGAFAHARRALELNPNEPGAVEILRQSRGEPVISFRDGKMAVREEDLLTQPQGKMAAAMAAAMYAANPELIEEEFKGAIEMPPEAAEEGNRRASTPSAKDYLDRAEYFFGQARFQEALNYYKLAIESDPNLAQAYMGIGDVYYRQGQYQQAIAYFEESIAITPDPYTYRFLGDAYRQVGKYKQAEEAYREALKLSPAYGGARKALQDLLEGRKPDEG